MRAFRRHLLIVAALAFCGAAALAARTQPPASAAAELPPVTWVCPMHPEEVDSKPNKCSKCGMQLERVRLDQEFSCPLHTQIVSAKGGKCPICQRDLVSITVSLSWKC